MTKKKVKLNLVNLPTGKPHVSFSELSMWFGCTWAHKLAQIDKLDKYVQNVHALFGTAIHAALQDFLETRKMKVEIATDMIDKMWDKMRANPPSDVLSGDDLEKWKQSFSKVDIKTPRGRVIVQGRETWKKQARAILAEIPAFMDDNFPNWEFVEAEHQLYEQVEGFEHAFKGFIDGVITCLDKRGKKRLTWLIDWKTSTRGWFKEKKQDVMTKNQLILYKRFWCQKTGANFKDVRCAFVILKREGKPGTLCDFFPVSVGDITSERAGKLVKDMLVTLHRGIAIKDRTGCKWCDYFGTEHCDSIYRQI